jgi:hypothetical protein
MDPSRFLRSASKSADVSTLTMFVEESDDWMFTRVFGPSRTGVGSGRS